MSGDLIEQQQWGPAALGRHEPRLPEKNCDQERLLLAGRAVRGGHAAGFEGDEKIAPMRSQMGTTSLGIKGAAGREPGAHPLLRGKGRSLGEPDFDLAL